MILDPFPELSERPTIVHVRTQTFSDRAAPFIRQTILGLRPFFDNVVLAPDTDCANPADVKVEIVHKDQLRDPVACRSLARYLRDRYNAVRLVVGHMGNGIREGRQLAERLDVPLLGIFGGSDVNVELHGERYRDAYRELLAIPGTHFLTVASYLRDKLLEWGASPERVFAWHRGVDLSAFEPRPRIDRTKLRLVIAGRLLEVKGHEYAIRAMAKLRGRAELVLLGDGPLRDELEKLARGLDVRFLGHVAHGDVVRTLRDADVYLHPSVTCSEGRVEGIPNAIMEASACGLPVIATTSGGIGEVVLDGESGFLVPERDPDALAARIEQLIASRELREQMGARGRAHVVAEFDLAKQSRRLAARMHHAIAAGDLFAQRGWPFHHPRNQPLGARSQIAGEKLTSALQGPHFTSSRKLAGPFIVGYKRAVYAMVFRPFLKFIGREVARFVGREVAELGVPGARGGAATDHVQRMSDARCLDCPHGTPATPWPDAPCPMDRGCVEALAHEFVPIARVRAAPSGALVLDDVDAPLPHPDASQPKVHYRGDLQRVSDPARLFVELRRILTPDGALTLDIWPLPLGRDGAGLAIPFAQLLFEPSLLGQLSLPARAGVAAAEERSSFALAATPRSLLRRPRAYGVDDLVRWASDAGLVVRAIDAPPRDEDPCEMHVQARFAALLRGRTRRSLARAFVATLVPGEAEARAEEREDDRRAQH